MDAFKVPKRAIEKPLRVPIFKIFKIGGIGTVVQGRVETGVLRPNMKVTFAPYGYEGIVNTIQSHRQAIDSAPAGTHVGFNVKNVPAKAL